MAHIVPFRLKLTGDSSEQHRFQAYDGYMSLAGFAWSLSLVSNYVETGTIRHRGDFPGRVAVQASAIQSGSIVADFIANISQNATILGGAGTIGLGIATNFVYDLMKRTVGRNLGHDVGPETEVLQELQHTRGGDLEALVAATEPAIRQSHDVIGRGAQVIQIYGGSNVINVYNAQTKEYVQRNVEDHTIMRKDVSVASFNANSGHGSVFDRDLGRTIPIKLNKQTLQRAAGVISWGLDQYANRTGRTIDLTYWRILAMDGTPKRYMVVDAEKPSD